MRTWDEQRRRVWRVKAHIEWGHELHVDDDGEGLTCRQCGAEMRNDACFTYPNRCPIYWDGETLRDPPDDFLAYPCDQHEPDGDPDRRTTGRNDL